MFAKEYKKIGGRLAMYRRMRGMSQSELEHKSGISRTTISKIENGIGSYNIDCVFILAKALGIGTGQILDKLDEDGQK